MRRFKDYILLHLNICLFSFTGIFSKLASGEFNKHGVAGFMLYVYLGLMLLNCALYAFAWQRIIKKFDLSFAFANRSVYLIWSQVWAAVIFKESLTVCNIIGMLIVLIGVMIVQLANSRDIEREETRA